MGCFLGCFGGAKERRRRRRSRKRSPAQSPNGRARAAPRVSPKKVDLDGEAVSAAAPLLGKLLELRDSTDDLCLAVVKKKVTFDPNVTTYEAAAIPEDDREGTDPDEDEATREEDWMLAPECAKSEAFPLNHRYSNCAGNDDDSEYEEEEEEDDDDEYEDCYEQEDGIDECPIDDEDEEHGLLSMARGEEEACESLFLLPMSKKVSKESSDQEAAPSVTAPEAPVASAARDRSSEHANPVLSSVENLTQWKEPKSRAAPAPKSSDKENVVLGQENRMALLAEPAIAAKKKEERPAVSDYSYSPSTPSKQEASVDASLSTWLGSSGTPESNSVRSYSPISREDRPILGALTMEDIKISSANSSPRRSRSPSPSPDDMPILGTVGAYWNCSAKGDDAVTRGGFMRTRTRFG
ncbi:hypothetical protein PR202_ga27127 [Eleusine coracana subsp. coracana]|uniref:Uncharacterized protein n=1 Tax=Eleusine coracana subsp. coracana TaxID=191504 RepID=A0AAV5DGC2_ELECO|nr:hypothetical protein QOZ80_3AG0233010 [Eleusine coracana subsp. coracana]GJN09147.1 hypothetical protein PR202_ga27127 [Eleusine coracana subsp. coracana]